MAYVKKTWVDRHTEFPGRRKLTATDTAEVYDVTREEGLEIEAGDALNAANLNALEERIGAGFEGAAPKAVHVTATLLEANWVGDTAPYTYTLAVAGVTPSGAGETDQMITAPATATDEEYAAFQAANIRDGGQGEGTIILKALGEKPEIDLPVLVIKHGPSAQEVV